MEQTILVKHKQAYDTEENWKTNNPVLLAGQLAYSSDKYGKYKIGDGVTHWNDLEYCNDSSIAFTSDDNLNPLKYSDVALLKSGEKHSSIFNKLSTMFKNVRYLYKMLGSTDISTIGGGTVTGALSGINADLAQKLSSQFNVRQGSFDDITTPGIYSILMDTVEKSPENSGWSCALVWNLDKNPRYTVQLVAVAKRDWLYLRHLDNGVWGEWRQLDTVKKDMSGKYANFYVPNAYYAKAEKQILFHLPFNLSDYNINITKCITYHSQPITFSGFFIVSTGAYLSNLVITGVGQENLPSENTNLFIQLSYELSKRIN